MYGKYSQDPNAGKRAQLESLQLDQGLSQAKSSLPSKEMGRLVDMARQYNENPLAFEDFEVKWLKDTAPQAGIDISEGLRKDKKSFKDSPLEHLAAGGFGALDAVLFDLLKDSWYSNRHTKTAKNVGKVTGTLASLAYGFGAFGTGAKAVKAASNAKSLLGTYGDDIVRLTSKADDAAGAIKTAGKHLDDTLTPLREGWKSATGKVQSLGDEITGLQAKLTRLKNPKSIALNESLILKKQAEKKAAELTVDGIMATQRAAKIAAARTIEEAERQAARVAADLAAKKLQQVSQQKIVAALEKKAAKAGSTVLKRWGMPGILRGYAGEGRALARSAKAWKAGGDWGNRIIATAKPMFLPIARDIAGVSAIPRMMANADPMNIPVETSAAVASIPMMGNMGGYSGHVETLPLYMQMLQQQRQAAAAQTLQTQQ